MSRTYRKPREHYEWPNADSYARYNKKWQRLRWKIEGRWVNVTEEYAYEASKIEYKSWGYDGAVHRGSRCKEFSDLCARDLRNANKEYISKGKWAHEMPPDEKNGRKFIWAVW